ncbi:MAG: SpoIIE family protein phosphatase [Bacteroides sp.]
METDDIKISYSRGKLEESARTFRKLGESCADCEIAEQLTMMADVLEDCIMTGNSLKEPENGVKNSIEKKLARRGIRVKNLCMLVLNDKPMEVVMQARTARRGSISTREIVNCLEEMLGCGFEPSDANRRFLNEIYHDYIFIQSPRYQTIVGKAFVTSKESGVSGDNYSVANLCGGKLAVTLADGMGSGPRARHESGIVVELLEQSLDAGFDAKSAIGLINAAISSGKRECNPVTVDTCVVDRYLGVARFIKLGAASTFIKRDGWVEIIKSTTLPIGVLEKMDYDSTVKKLYDGDYIIMVSDGVIESLDGEDKDEQMVKIIQDIDVKVPDIIAQKILKEVCADNDEGNADDMSVLVTGVFDTAINMY